MKARGNHLVLSLIGGVAPQEQMYSFLKTVPFDSFKKIYLNM